MTTMEQEREARELQARLDALQVETDRLYADARTGRPADWDELNARLLELSRVLELIKARRRGIWVPDNDA